MAHSSWRPHQVRCTLSEEDYALLCTLRTALHLTTRDLLLIGLRRARTVWRAEQRRQGRNEQH